MKYAIEQDMAYNTDNINIFKEYQKIYNFDYLLIEEHGPAGGNPLYLLISPDLNTLINLTLDLNKQNDLDKDYIKTYISFHTRKYQNILNNKINNKLWNYTTVKS
jgi:hypothetical protein